MSLMLRHLHSTTSTSTSTLASEIASSFLRTLQTRPPLLRTQCLDANQLRLLGATLPYPTPSLNAQLHSPIPPCHHLIYFTPSDPENQLADDGSERVFNPPAPFTRRMWAGGQLEWVRGNELCVGQEVQEEIRVRTVEAKVTRAGKEMLVVGLEKVFENEKGVALVDKRKWIFRPSLDPNNPPPSSLPPPFLLFPSAPHTRSITQTPLSLFRFSALTFNAHKIHYNREWCREVEGHRDCVVHGPLNLIHMVDFWRDVMSLPLSKERNKGEGKEDGGDVLMPKKVTYRAASPLYVKETYKILMEEESEKVAEVRIVDGTGKVGMFGRIERW